LRKELIRRIDDAQLLKILGLNDDDVIISFARTQILGYDNWSGWLITYSTKIEEEKDSDD
jgi:hypothetical protein